MKKYLGLVCLILVVFLLVPMVVLASYNYAIPIEVYNNDTDSWSGPVLITLNNSQLASLGYINSSGLDTAVQEGASSREYLVADARLGLFIEDIEGYQSRTYSYRLGESPPQTVFPFIAGYEGNTTISDHADLELGNDFNITFETWLDSSGSEDLVEKGEDFLIGTSSGNIHSQFYLSPTVESTNTSTSAGTSHTVSLPSGLESGDLILMVFGIYQTSSLNITWPSGWDELVQHTYCPTSCVQIGIAYEEATGSEGSTAVVNTSLSCGTAHQTFRISSCSGTPEASSYTTGGTYPDSDSLTPSWGDSEYTLYFSVFAGRTSNDFTVSSYPSGYSGGQLTKYSSTINTYVGSCRKLAMSSPEDPGTYTLSDSTSWVAYTIGVRGDSRTVTATLPSNESNYDVWADGTNFGINIDGISQNATALSGVSVPDNSSDWVVSLPYFNSYNHTVSGSLEAWYQSNTMVLGTSLTDRTGNGHTGTISWGSNPSNIEITIGGITPYTAFVVPGSEDDDDIPEVVPPPGDVDMAPATGATGVGLPLYVNFQRAADSLGWTVPVTYVVMFFIIAIVMGFAGLVATKSIWGFVFGFGGMMAFFGAVQDGGGYYIVPIWITIGCIGFAIFLGYAWRYS